MREPLPGWEPEYDQMRLHLWPLSMSAAFDGEWGFTVDDAFGDVGDDIIAAQLAAEDAARALVADMAAALGGVVVWPEADGGGGPMQAGGQK